MYCSKCNEPKPEPKKISKYTCNKCKDDITSNRIIITNKKLFEYVKEKYNINENYNDIVQNIKSNSD